MRNLPEFSVRNPVAVNLVMIFLIIVGAYFAVTLTREFFPPTDPEIIYIGMTYPGSTPEEVERGITKRIEDAILDLEGIEKITSNIVEGSSNTIVEVETGYDKKKLLDEIQREIDRITDFPEEANEPVIFDIDYNIPAISVVVYGDAGERRLKRVAEEIEDVIRQRTRVAAINQIGARTAEWSVEIDPELLDRYNLTTAEVSDAVRRSNLDLPAGEIKSPEGNILVRTLGEEDAAGRLRDIIVRSNPDGTEIRLGDVAEISDTFVERKQMSFFRGKRAVTLTIFKSRDQDAIKIAADVREVVREFQGRYTGDAIQLEVRSDTTRFINQRQNLLLRNGLQGLVLVFLCLVFFLEFDVAKWVALGLPVSFLGTFIVMHLFGVSINMISLFGLIIVIGLIVDDAIVIGENVFRHYEEGMPAHRAAIEGAREVTWPVIAAVATTIIAFAPLLFLEGIIGDFLGELPLVVIAALLVSLVEALIILPSHLAESLFKMTEKGPQEHKGLRGKYDRIWDRKERFLNETLPDLYEGWLRLTLRWRYTFILSMSAILIVTVGFVGSGLLKFVFIQETDSEVVLVGLDMGVDTPAEVTADVVERMRAAAASFPEVEGVLALVGISFRDDGTGAEPASEGTGQLVIDLHKAEVRDREGLMSSDQFMNALREKIGPIPGANSVKYQAAQGGPPGADIEIELRAPSYETLEQVVEEVRQRLAAYDGVTDIEDSLQRGKAEVRIRLLPSAEPLGLTTRELARQVRGAFFGDEAQSLQRDREEVKVYTRLTREAREDIASLENLRIKTPSGARIPFSEVAEMEMSRGYSLLQRIDGRRASKVTANVVEARANTTEITNDITPFLDEMERRFPSLTYEFSGEKKKTTDAFGSLTLGAPAALLAIYCLLAIIFHSYLQPLMIMAAIPFGIVGAVWGHPVMAYPITILSIIGIVALSGIVVNDSLILVDFVNEELRRGERDVIEAVIKGGRKRLRPILLTSLTTVFGLAPLMMERSFQAQFLIPMAVSISFGLAFATIITLLLIPSLYMVIEDIRSLIKWLKTGRWERAMPIGMKRRLLEEAVEASYREHEEKMRASAHSSSGVPQPGDAR